MKDSSLSRATSVFGALLLLLTTPGWSAQTLVLPGHVPAIVKSLQPAGRLSDTNRLNLAIGLPLRNQAALSKLLEQIYDPASPNYHHYLTPEEFTAQFGPTEQDYQKVIQFARVNGLTVTKTHGNRMLVDVSGNVSDVGKAFHVTMQTYQHPTEGRTFFAPDTEPSVDSSVPVLHVSGLDNYVLPRPLLHKMAVSQARPQLGSGPSGSYMGSDFQNAYVPGTSLNGSGQMVGLLQFNSGFYQSDITAYETQASLPNVPVQAVLLDGYGGGAGVANDEVSLDIEMVISMAPGVSKIYVFEGNITDDILNAMAASNQVKQLSASWSYNIDATSEQIFQQFAAQGQSFFNASGDDDAWLTGQIATPCDDPYITIVGGTTLSTANNAWSSETVWNWGTELGIDGVGSGGGISTTYAIPSWQTNINMTASQGSTTFRNIPDVALTGDNVFVKYGNGSQGVFGGTSCATPLWAGFMALVNQQAATSGKPPIGFANPAIYAIGKGANYTSAFHDITTGNNTWSGSTNKFYAVSGYDLCTGWGTPAGQYLINALANPEALVITPPTGFTSAGGFGGPFTVTSQNLSLTNVGTNSLTWMLANTSAWLTVSSSGGTLTSGGPAATVTASLNSAASNLVVGTYSATLWFTNLNDSVGQGRPFNLSVVSPPVITMQPTNQAVLQGATASFTVAAAGGQPLSYQWRDNGTNLADGGHISGSATTNLVVSNVSSNDIGTYTIIVTNIAGAVTSSNALLTITPSPPVIVMQPSNQTAIVGGTATFTVTVIGTTPFLYQWNFDGTNISGATNTSLTLTNVQLTQAGTYAVAITNAYGSTNSANATLGVLVAPPCDPPPSGLVAWWRAENNANDSIGTNNGTPIGGITYTNGEVGQAFVFDGSSDYITVPASPSLNLGTSNGLTIEGWINPSAANNPGGPLIEWDSSTADGLQFWADGDGSLWANIKKDPSNSYGLGTASGVIVTNQLQHVAVTYDKQSGMVIIYTNGNVVASKNIGNVTPDSTYEVNLGRRTASIGSGDTYGGLIDELSLYNRALSSNEIAAIYTSGSEGKCFTPIPPFIISQPTNQTVNLGGTANFNVTASGTPLLTCQWNFNGTNIVGATNATLTLFDAQFNQAGNYAVLVTNTYGSILSSNALLTVNPPPPCDPAPSGLIAMWEAEGNASDSIGNNNGSLLGGLGFTNGEVGQAFNFTNNTDGVLVPASSNLAAQSMTIEAWIYPTDISIQRPIVEYSTAGGPGMVQFWYSWDNNGTQPGALYGLFRIPSGGGMSVATVGGLIPVNQWSHVAMTFDYATQTGFLYVNGMNVASNSYTGPGTLVPQTTIPLNLGYRPDTSDESFAGFRHAGKLDEVSIYNRALTAAEIAAIYNAGSAGKCPVPPTIIVQPTNQTVVAGNPTAFTVTAVGTQPLSYQWSFNGTNIASATNILLALNNVQTNQAGNYAVLVTNAYGSIISSNAMLMVTALPPTITLQPTNQTVVVGSMASFNVMATGSSPLSYQWKKNGTNLVGQTSTNFTIVNVQTNDAGTYSVAVTNAFGSAISSNALLTVNPPPSCNPAPPGLVAWWPAEGNANDSVGTNNGTPVGGVTYTNGEVGRAFMLDNVNTTTSYIPLPASPSLNLGTSSGLTIECWIKPDAATLRGGAPIIEWDSATTDGLQLWIDLSANIKDTSGNSHSLAADGLVNSNSFQHVALTYDKNSGNAFLYYNGVAVATVNIGNITPQTTYPVNIGRRTGQPIGNGSNYGGLIDELSLYNRALSSSEITAIYNAGNGGKCPPSAPFIVMQPTNQTVVVGGTVIFTVQAVGTQPLTYQWKKNGANIGGATSTNFTIVSVQTNDAATYSVAITNAYGSVISSNAVLAVLAPPTITLQPVSRTNLAGTIATFTNAASGTLPLNYQWRKNGANLNDGGNVSGSATNILTLTNVQDAAAASYSVVVTNIVGSVTSSPAILVLLDPPAILSQPTNLTVTLTSNTTFSVIASGSPALSYQWNFNGTNIVGATNTSLILTNVRLNQAGGYTVLVTNNYGSVLSSNAMLVVNPLLYFVWNQIPSPRFVNAPFAVVIRAQNLTNGIVTNFTDTVILLSTNGVPVSPAVSGNFIQGVWTGAVTVAQTGTNLVLQATDNLGDSGLANPINVVSLPALTTAPSGNTLYIFWPVNPSGFVLETTTGLSPANWVPTPAPIKIGDQYLESIQMSGTNAFYRLRFSGP